jgi:predicted DNA-binding transcriptional regulator AlpA
MKEAAAYLQVDYQTMRKYVRGENAPKHLQITARCIRFPYDDFMAWVESKARGGNGV